MLYYLQRDKGEMTMKEVITPIKELKTDVFNYIKYRSNSTITVKIYDCEDNNEQTYDIEICVGFRGENEYFVSDRFFEGELKEAEKRAKAILKIVKNWFRYDELVIVEDQIEVYHM